jgi:hypothetical protein
VPFPKTIGCQVAPTVIEKQFNKIVFFVNPCCNLHGIAHLPLTNWYPARGVAS